MTITPIRDAHGEVTHFIATKQDVTERKIMEAQLQQSGEDRSGGRLAGGIAHDFNNLLTVINGYAELLLEKFGSDHEVSGSREERLQGRENAPRAHPPVAGLQPPPGAGSPGA